MTRPRLSVGLAVALAAASPSACAGPRGPGAAPAPDDDADPRRVLDRFTTALEAGRYDDAYRLLSARWRASETPGRLAADLAASGAAGRDALRRVRALLSAGAALRLEGDAATLPVGEGSEARLTREGGAWRVDRLE